MGALCGKESKADNFSSPGRPLGSAPPPQPTTAPVPKTAPRVGGPPRTLGGGGGTSGDGDHAPDEQRRRAAEAAEARAKAANKSTGKLGQQLSAQKKQTRNDTLAEASLQERQHRDADANAAAREYN